MNNVKFEVVTELKQRGTFVPQSKIRKMLTEDKELYRSYFGYSEEIMEHIALGRKTAQGFIGKFYLPNIVLDIDKGKNSDEYTLSSAKDFYQRLISEFSVEPVVFFSGTGYHFVIPDIFGFEASAELPVIVRNTIQSVFPEVDTKPINARGLIRVNFSYNKKSGLYKTYLPNFLEMEVEDVKALSKEQNIVKLPKLKPSNKFHHLIVDKKTISVAIPKLEFSRIFPCFQAIWKEGEVEGTRHNRILRLASWQRRNGLPIDATIALMEKYAPSLSQYEIKRIVADVYKKGYSYSCNDAILQQYCNASCIFHSSKYVDDVVEVQSLEEKYHSFIASDWQKESVNLFPLIDRDFFIPPESLTGIIGGTGVNKTAFVQNIAVFSKHLAPILYINTEFGHNILFRRFIQIAHKMTKEEVENHYKHHRNGLSKDIEHIVFLNRIPDIDQIKQLVMKHKPKLLIIDVVDDVIKRGKHGLESEEFVAKELNDLAKQNKLIVLAVHHIAKNNAFDERGNPKPLTVFSSKGTASFPQKCDILIGIEGKASDTKRVIRSLKGRDNKPFLVIKAIEPSTMRFVELL